MKVTNIRGKDYIEVAERVKFFNENYQNGDIDTELSYDGNYVRCKATITPDVDKPNRKFTGHAEEDRTQGNINKTNATENCETSAVGRALAMMGIGIVDGVASADEVAHAIYKQEVSQTAPNAPQSSVAPNVAPTTRNCAVCNKEFIVDPRYPKGLNCSATCGAAYKKGERYTPLEELPVIQQEASMLETDTDYSGDLPF